MARTPREWITWYYEVRDSHGAPALRFVDSVGRLYAEKCRDCGSRTRHARNDGSWACGHCGRDWDFDDRFLLKGEVQKSVRHDGFELKNGRQFDIARLVANLLREHPIPGHLFVANAMHHPIRQLCELGPEMWPDWDLTWTKHSVHEAVKQGEAIWEDMLLLAGVPYQNF